MGELKLGERLSLTAGPDACMSNCMAVVTGLSLEYAPSVMGGKYAAANTGTLGTKGNANGLFSVYNFQVADYHTYFAAPEADKPFVWVHNAGKGYAAQKAAQKAAKNSPHQGELFKCIECADDIIAGVNKAGHSAHKVTAEFPAGWIWSDSLGRNIAENGRHVGVFVRGPKGGLVYDNFRPEGMPFKEWVRDMWNRWPKDLTITTERFVGGN